SQAGLLGGGKAGQGAVGQVGLHVRLAQPQFVARRTGRALEGIAGIARGALEVIAGFAEAAFEGGAGLSVGRGGRGRVGRAHLGISWTWGDAVTASVGLPADCPGRRSGSTVREAV